MNIEESFLFGLVAGIVATIIFAGIIAIVVAYERHQCKFCDGHTQKICRLFGLHGNGKIIPGKLFALYVFRVCKKGHVTLSVKTVFLTAYEITKKSSDEFEWRSFIIQDLCRRSDTPSPFIELPGKFLITHPILNHPRFKFN